MGGPCDMIKLLNETKGTTDVPRPAGPLHQRIRTNVNHNVIPSYATRLDSRHRVDSHGLTASGRGVEELPGPARTRGYNESRRPDRCRSHSGALRRRRSGPTTRPRIRHAFRGGNVSPTSFPNREYEIEITCPEFTAVCPKTGQPDFGTIVITYVPAATCLELKSLKLYLFGFRDRGIFYEHAVNTILDDLVASCRPVRMKVVGQFNPRGGITSRITATYEAARA